MLGFDAQKLLHHGGVVNGDGHGVKVYCLSILDAKALCGIFLKIMSPQMNVPAHPCARDIRAIHARQR
jgi:hypothetical protein